MAHLDTDRPEPEIYVASLSDYNSGILYGRWISCGKGVDHIRDEIEAMLEKSPYAKEYGERAEEWAIHAHRGFYEIDIPESASFDELCELADGINEHGEPFAAYCGYTRTWDITRFTETFCGIYDNETAYAEEIADECLDIPEPIQPYFDYEAYARDIFINSYRSERVSGGVAVFQIQ